MSINAFPPVSGGIDWSKQKSRFKAYKGVTAGVLETVVNVPAGAGYLKSLTQVNGNTVSIQTLKITIDGVVEFDNGITTSNTDVGSGASPNFGEWEYKTSLLVEQLATVSAVSAITSVAYTTAIT